MRFKKANNQKTMNDFLSIRFTNAVNQKVMNDFSDTWFRKMEKEEFREDLRIIQNRRIVQPFDRGSQHDPGPTSVTRPKKYHT